MNEADTAVASPRTRWRREEGALIAELRGVVTAARMMAEVRDGILGQLATQEAAAIVIDFRGSAPLFSSRQIMGAASHRPLFGRSVAFLVTQEQLSEVMEYSALMSEVHDLSRPVFLQLERALRWAQAVRRCAVARRHLS